MGKQETPGHGQICPHRHYDTLCHEREGKHYFTLVCREIYPSVFFPEGLEEEVGKLVADTTSRVEEMAQHQLCQLQRVSRDDVQISGCAQGLVFRLNTTFVFDGQPSEEFLGALRQVMAEAHYDEKKPRTIQEQE